MAYRFRLIAALFFSLLSLTCFSGIPKVTGYKISTGSSGIIYHSVPELCSSSEAQSYAKNYPDSRGTSSKSTHYAEYGPGIGTQSVNCYIWGLNKVDGSPVWLAGLPYSPSGKVCPSNSSPSGDECVCNEGYEEKNGNSCEKPKEPDACESLAEKCETLSGSLKVIDIKKSVDYRPFKTCTPAGLVPGCSKGCAIQSSGLGTYYKDQSGNSYFQGQGTVLAETCLPVVDGNGEPPKETDNPLPPSEPDEKPCKPGEYQGTVNGTKVCLPAKSSETLVKQETAENADGSKTETNVSVKCEGGKCTVTETVTNKDSSGATTGTASKDSVTSQSNFCALNPGSEVCKSAKSDGEDGEDDKSTFTGSCDSNFKCEGDSVQCAIALEQHRTSCKLFDESNPYWQAFKDAEAGNSTGVESTTVDLASHVTVDSVIGAGVCPADVEVIVFNQTIPFPLSKFCPYFDTMGMLIMLGAAIGCLRILGSG